MLEGRIIKIIQDWENKRQIHLPGGEEPDFRVWRRAWGIPLYGIQAGGDIGLEDRL